MPMPESVSPADPVESAGLRQSLPVLAQHTLCLVLPLSCTAYLLSAPHAWWATLPWALVIVGSVVADIYSPSEVRQPHARMPGWPFDGMLYVLVFLQILNVALLVLMVSRHGFFRFDSFMAWQLVGISSGYSGIVVAHELIHRRSRRQQFLGRMILTSVLYEHFFTEHIRGHHVLVATGDDPATARFGETSWEHFTRTVPGQLRSAWRLETRRLGDESMSLIDRRQIRNRVLHGLLAGWGIAALVGLGLGLGAFVVYVAQAYIAVSLLETVNYIEHWGLQRASSRVTTVDSWDTDSWFTLYTLVGLSRHADHHAHAMRPYQQLRHFEESPKLPYGYFGSVVMALFRNARFRERMTAELERVKLGPFAPQHS